MAFVKYLMFGSISWIIYLCFGQQCIMTVNTVEGFTNPNRSLVRGWIDYLEDDFETNPHFIDGKRNQRNSDSMYKYLGCYDQWENALPYSISVINRYLEGLNVNKCEKLCKSKHGDGYTGIYLLRGSFCSCVEWIVDELVKVEEEICNIQCEGELFSRCGGNYAISLYCNPNTNSENENNCTNYDVSLKIVYKEYIDKSDLSSLESESHETIEINSTTPNNLQLKSIIIPILPCFNCTIQHRCTASSFHSNLAYMPQNSPYNCIEFCSKKLKFYNPKTGTIEIRDATKFANVGWANRGIQVPTCGCFNELPAYENLTLDYCNYTCPLNEDSEMCGGKAPFIFTMYETEINQAPGTVSTVTELSTISTSYEYASESVTPTIESSTITSTTVETTLNSSFVTISITTEIRTSTELITTMKIDPTDEATTAPLTTILPTTLAQVKPIDSCDVKCENIDTQHGQSWTTCPGHLAKQSCPKGAKGIATWECSPSGLFIGLPNYSNCSTFWIGNITIGDNVTAEEAKEIFNKIHSEVMDTKNKPGINYFGHEMNDIIEIIREIFSKLKTDTEKSFENLTETTIAINEHLLVNSRPWEELVVTNRSIVGNKVIKLIEDSVIALTLRATVADNISGVYRKYFKTSDKIKISGGGQEKSWTGNKSIHFPFNNELSDGSYIELPEGWANHIPSTQNTPVELNFLGMAISSDLIKPIFTEASVGVGLNENKKNINKFMNGKLMSFTLAKSNENMINFPVEGVKIQFRHDLDSSISKMKNLKRQQHYGEIPKPVYESSQCAYWDTTNLAWSTIGCKLVKSEVSTTLCECSHLTSFAVLMDMHNYMGKEFALEILTLILCPLSIICLFTTIIIFTFVKSTHGARTTITKNLCISLLIGNSSVLLIVDRHYLNMSDEICAASAIIVHYVFLTAFMWMAIQGYHLYKQMVHVFETGRSHMMIYRILAFGLPLLIVGITVVIAFLKDAHAYGGEMFCWLQGYYIWSFMAPVAIVCLANTIVLIITLRAAYQVRTTNALVQMRIRSSKTWIKGCLSITVLLGLTWITGYFMMIDSISSTIAAYVFTILNVSQGIYLFIFHCLLNEKVRIAAARKNISLPSWLTSTTPSQTDFSQSKSKEMKGQFPEWRKEDGQIGSDINKRRGYINRQINNNNNTHTPIGIVSSIDSNSSLKSSSGNESSGRKFNLIYSQKRQLKI